MTRRRQGRQDRGQHRSVRADLAPAKAMALLVGLTFGGCDDAPAPHVTDAFSAQRTVPDT